MTALPTGKATLNAIYIKGKRIVTVIPPPEFGGKEAFCVPEEVFAAFFGFLYAQRKLVADRKGCRNAEKQPYR